MHPLGDIYGPQVLQAFQDIQKHFNLPGTSFFFYLQLCTAMHTYGVPWNIPLPIHAFHTALTSPSGLVSKLYSMFHKASCKPLSTDRLWKTDLSSNSSNLNWKLIWQNIQLSSRNPNHQVIHFNFIHRTYFTPRILHKMKPNCTLCNQNAFGTFFHMVWEFPRVAEFWKRVAEMLSNILSKTIPYLPEVLLLDDSSNLELCVKQKRLWLAGLTAAKRLIACRWKAPHYVNIQRWLKTKRA